MAETTTTESTTTTTPATTTPTETTTTPATPAAFDWSTAGLDDVGLHTVTTKGWKGPADVVGSYRHLETAIGVPPERLIKLPKDATDQKGWNEVFTKLGRPEKAEAYVIPVPEGDKGEFAGVAKSWFHEAGLTQSAATKLATKWNEYLATTQQTAQAKQEQEAQISVQALKKEWGADYDAKAAQVDKAAETFGMTQAHLSALKQVLGPKDAMQFLHNIGARLGVEDTTVPGLTNKGGFQMTQQQALAALEAKKQDKTFSQLFTSQDPKQRQEAREEMNRLYQLAYPGFTEHAGVRTAKT